MNKPIAALSRRQFVVGAAGSSLVLGLGSALGGCQPDQAASDLVSQGGSASFSPVMWFEIDAKGAIKMNIVRAEMGQHVGTALAQVIADELGAAWEDVSIQHVDTDPKWGYMVTGGSWSYPCSITGRTHSLKHFILVFAVQYTAGKSLSKPK
jgi:isoquinoline 1-oxidoreductase beta subunit